MLWRNQTCPDEKRGKLDRANAKNWKPKKKKWFCKYFNYGGFIVTMATWIDLVAARSSNLASPSVMLASTHRNNENPEEINQIFTQTKSTQLNNLRKSNDLLRKWKRNGLMGTRNPSSQSRDVHFQSLPWELEKELQRRQRSFPIWEGWGWLLFVSILQFERDSQPHHLNGSPLPYSPIKIVPFFSNFLIK